MVRDYTVDYYTPAAEAARVIVADGFAGAKALADYRHRIDSAWPAVRVAQVDSHGLPESR